MLLPDSWGEVLNMLNNSGIPEAVKKWGDGVGEENRD
jgi:hypothetical protein